MNPTPEMIDAAVIQLKMLFEHLSGVPEKVTKSGKEFVAALDEWSEELKKEPVKA